MISASPRHKKKQDLMSCLKTKRAREIRILPLEKEPVKWGVWRASINIWDKNGTNFQFHFTIFLYAGIRFTLQSSIFCKNLDSPTKNFSNISRIETKSSNL